MIMNTSVGDPYKEIFLGRPFLLNNIPYGKTTCQKKYQSNFFVVMSYSMRPQIFMGPVGPGLLALPHPLVCDP